jgi:hypothetical protein
MPAQVAAQLTIIDFDFLSRVAPAELVAGNWSTPSAAAAAAAAASPPSSSSLPLPIDCSGTSPVRYARLSSSAASVSSIVSGSAAEAGQSLPSAGGVGAGGGGGSSVGRMIQLCNKRTTWVISEILDVNMPLQQRVEVRSLARSLARSVGRSVG